MSLSRRRFITTGLAGSALLSLSGWLNAAGVRPLSVSEREMLGAVVSAMLDGVLPEAGEERRGLVARTVDGIAAAVAGLSDATQKEIGELFGLLVLAPGRWMIAGVGRSWDDAGVEEVSRFLQAWRTSRLGLLQGAYAALHDLTFGAWYARPETWEAIAYPGPPRGYF